MDKPRQFSGSITITRPINQNNDQCIEITLTDETSRVEFIEVRMSLADFASAITGHGYLPMKFEVRGLNVIGMKHEVKTESVPWDHSYDEIAKDRKKLDDIKDSPLTRKALAPFEVDGWRGYTSDLFNSHRRDHKAKTQTVSFRRYVDPVTGRPVL